MKSIFDYNRNIGNINDVKNIKTYCTNCGKYGHLTKYCKEPVISLGIILFKYCKKKKQLYYFFLPIDLFFLVFVLYFGR